MQSSKKNKKLEAALEYARMEISVIPWGDEKNKPLLNTFTEYQTRRASEDEIRAWWTTWPEANITAVMGEISNLVMFDVDKQHGRSASEFDIPATACTRTPHGGNHFFFKYPGYSVRARDALFGKGADFKGDGGLAHLPCTSFPLGEYEWVIPLEDGVADMPPWLIEKIRQNGASEKMYKKGINGVIDGYRNSTAASWAGRILATCPEESRESLGWPLMLQWDKQNKPPLGEKVLRKRWESIKKKHIAGGSKKQPGKNLPDVVVDIALMNPQVVLFKTDLDEPFMQLPIGTHLEYWSCKDKKVRLWLAQEYWNTYGKTVSTDAINTALQVLEGNAFFKGKQIPLSNRVTEHEGSLYWSLSNPEWEAVRINEEGWEVVKNPPILFRRYSHQMAQAYPVPGGDIASIFKYINVKDEEERILLTVLLVSCFIPGFPHPIIYFYGPQGSAKSTASRILKRIIDPSKIEVSEMPKDQKDLVQKLSHHWFIMFDNISAIGDELSDIMCRAVTGSGFSKRELYSDDSDIIYTFRRCIGINGINILASKPDLLERSILIELERVSKEGRLNEKELYEDFEKDLPGILGSIFTTLSKAMSIRPTVKLSELPRMADFALWGYAIAEALGYGGQRFIDAYNINIGQQHEQAINEDFVASFVVDLLQEQDAWEGSATELLELMKDSPEYNDKQPGVPKNAQTLSRQLNIVKTNLADTGILFERVEGQKRKVILRKVTGNIAPSAIPLQPSLTDDDF